MASSAVFPCWSRSLEPSAPFKTRQRMNSLLPTVPTADAMNSYAQMCKAVCPWSFCAFTLQPCSINQAARRTASPMRLNAASSLGRYPCIRAASQCSGVFPRRSVCETQSCRMTMFAYTIGAAPLPEGRRFSSTPAMTLRGSNHSCRSCSLSAMKDIAFLLDEPKIVFFSGMLGELISKARSPLPGRRCTVRPSRGMANLGRCSDCSFL